MLLLLEFNLHSVSWLRSGIQLQGGKVVGLLGKLGNPKMPYSSLDAHHQSGHYLKPLESSDFMLDDDWILWEY